MVEPLPVDPPALVMQLQVPGVSEAECLALGTAIARLLARNSDLLCLEPELATPTPPAAEEPTPEEREAQEIVDSAGGREIAT